MKEMINAYSTPEKHSYIEVINHGTFNVHFSVHYSVKNSDFSFRSKNLTSGMLEKIIVSNDSINIHVVVYLDSQQGQSNVLYENTFSTATTLKLLLSGTELAPIYKDVTKHPSPNDLSELYSYYVSVTNTANYIANLTVQYTINNKNFIVNKDAILINHTQIIPLPTMAQNIQVSIKIRDKTTAWNSIYSNLLTSPSILKLSLSGTINNPIYKNISSELSLGKLPTLSDNAISVFNNGNFISQFYINYSLPDTSNTITTNKFSKGETKSVVIPSDATNIDLSVNIMYTDNSWINIYQNFFTNSTILKLELTGTLSVPVVTDITNTPPDLGDPTPVTPPTMKLTKFPAKPMIVPGEEIMFVLTTSHIDGDIAEKVLLRDTLPDEATFIPNSLTINGTATDFSFLSSGLDLGDMISGDSHRITYKIKFNSIPNPNIVKIDPTITYDYTDTDNTTKSGSLTGTTVPLMVGQNNGCPCICNCHEQDDSYTDYFDYI